MNKLIKDYVDGVAGEPVSDIDVENFIAGLDDFNNKTVVQYDTKENGFLVSKVTAFASFKAAMDFARKVKSFSKPLIR